MNIRIKTQTMQNDLGLIIIKAVATDTDNDEIVLTETIEIPFSALKKYGGSFLKGDLASSLTKNIKRLVKDLPVNIIAVD